MTTPLNEKRSFGTELRSLVLTTQCLSEYAAEHGDRQSAAILANVADLLEITVAKQSSHNPVAHRGTIAV